MPSWKILYILTNKNSSENHHLYSSGNIVCFGHDTGTDCFYYVQPIFQELSNMLPYFKFNPNGNCWEGGRPSHAHSEAVKAEAQKYLHL